MEFARGSIRLAATATLACAACACSPKPSSNSSPRGNTAFQRTAANPAEVPDPVVATAPEAEASERVIGGRQHRFSSLRNCKLLREKHAEMPFTESRCAGAAGWSLKIADSDGRQRFTLVPPAGGQVRLPLDRIGGAGFSSFGDTAEWRGHAGAGFTSDSLIVRYRVAERPYPAPETSYLLAITLVPSPCIVAVVRPGADQNSRARAAADQSDSCIKTG